MLHGVFKHLPRAVSEELRRLAGSAEGFPSALSEIRLRAGAVCSLLLYGKNVPLLARVSKKELSEVLFSVCHGSLYAFRDTLRNGYVPLEAGVRVGVVGQARYEGEQLVGVSEITSIIFRLPSHTCDTADAIYRAYLETKPRGMMIYSLPGGGKTTALRELAARLGSGSDAKRVVVVDERCEFDLSSYEHATVDILRGYRRHEGIELATRTLNPEVILVDEVASAAEASAMLSVLRAGVTVVATAHGASLEELKKRRALSVFFENGVFDVFVGIFCTGGTYSIRVDKEE